VQVQVHVQEQELELGKQLEVELEMELELELDLGRALVRGLVEQLACCSRCYSIYFDSLIESCLERLAGQPL